MAGKSNGRNIDVETQSPNSPDLNALDLAFNNSIESLARRIKNSCSSVSDFIEQVVQAFNDYPEEKLIRICALQLVAYREVLKACGGNQYDIQHTGIRMRQKANFDVHKDKYESCCDYNVSAGIVRTAVEFYERHTDTIFPWRSSKSLDHDDAAIMSGSAVAFDPEIDSDDVDDPNDDRSIDSDDDPDTI